MGVAEGSHWKLAMYYYYSRKARDDSVVQNTRGEKVGLKMFLSADHFLDINNGGTVKDIQS